MKTKSEKPLAGNGLQVFSIHSQDSGSKSTIAALKRENAAPSALRFAGAPLIEATDPETMARRYLTQALDSASAPQFNVPVADALACEFKSLGTETLPLTGTTTVKFRQNFSKIPVYGSLVTVELDELKNLLCIDSALGSPKGVSPVAKKSASDAIHAVAEYGGFKKDLKGIVPRLHFFFDPAKSKWRLVFILEDVPVVPKGSTKHNTPVLMDYVVDAQRGNVVAELPRTPTVAAQVSGVDGFGVTRNFQIEQSGKSKVLLDLTLNVQTFDFKLQDPVLQAAKLPGTALKNPPTFSPSAVGAHANASAVSLFLRNVLKRNNIDNQGGLMRSSINCVDKRDSPDGKQWINAFWNGQQMVYGQRKTAAGVLSMSAALDVVGHEMFHGVTDATARLEYAYQPGALNESYSDIFGVIIANQGKTNAKKWQWELGAGLMADGKPFRDMSNPPLWGQPDHMDNFQVLPNTDNGDYGGVHTNSGIHNKAAYNVLTASKPNGTRIFKPDQVAAVFYLALTQRLSRTSQFSDSRTAVINSARTLFRKDSAVTQAQKIMAIETAFSAVGIT